MSRLRTTNCSAANYPNGKEGELYRSDDEWWFQDNWSRSQRNADWAYKNSDDPINYHSEWMLRSRETHYDYSALTDLFRTVESPRFDQGGTLDAIIDPDLTLMMTAIRGYTYDWDSITLNRGKNGYMYRKATDGRWIFMHWDSDLAFQDANNIVVGGLAGVRTYVDKPYNRRLLNYYLAELLTKYSRNSARMDAWFTAEENASPAFTVNAALYTTWFANREARIITEINSAFGSGGTANAYSAPFAVSGPNPLNTALNVIDVSGTAPAAAYTVAIDGHPEAVLSWQNQTTWRLSGVVVAQGTNSLTVRTFARDGARFEYDRLHREQDRQRTAGCAFVG